MATNKQPAQNYPRIIAAVAYAVSEHKIELTSSNRDRYDLILEVAEDFAVKHSDKVWTDRELYEATDAYIAALYPDSGDVIITEDAETIDVHLCPNRTPTAYGRKFRELVDSGLTEDDARHFLLQPFEMELIYHYGQGLFAVESEAIDSISIYSPYIGRKVPKTEE